MALKADLWLFLLSLIAVIAGLGCYLYGMYSHCVFFLVIGLGYSAYIIKNQKEKHLGH
ncbi:hypothetical protein [Phaeodactylibacter sp.]|jgi:hypothetical protein|uniref:hypothetical protein n=1 Tax=Phaeodactylibacter sp. TaxID=1940289 RepID=UPI0025F6B4ED|nr:hypothetical protein [Phaeodactylibacter sp.]MCI4647501.1 hypothetical protein [Phaeodactylibacter sp.]MCI5093606.1 hypothetical protein [Phaeodactylibacter sp.]